MVFHGKYVEECKVVVTARNIKIGATDGILNVSKLDLRIHLLLLQVLHAVNAALETVENEYSYRNHLDLR